MLLSIQRALLGEIVPEMRAISADVGSEVVRLTVFVDGAISDALVEDFDAAVTQVVADFPYPDDGDPRIEFDVVRVDAPARIESRGTWVFFRKE